MRTEQSTAKRPPPVAKESFYKKKIESLRSTLNDIKQQIRGNEPNDPHVRRRQEVRQEAEQESPPPRFEGEKERYEREIRRLRY